MICTARTVSDTRWNIIAAAMAEKAKPTMLERVAATKITIDTATHNGASCARSARPCRNQPKCQLPSTTTVLAIRKRAVRQIVRPNAVANADMTSSPEQKRRPRRSQAMSLGRALTAVVLAAHP